MTGVSRIGWYRESREIEMRELNLTITVDEANLVLEGLGNLPFAKVYALVAKIQAQASRQLKGVESNGQETEPKPLLPQIGETSHAG